MCHLARSRFDLSFCTSSIGQADHKPIYYELGVDGARPVRANNVIRPVGTPNLFPTSVAFSTCIHFGLVQAGVKTEPAETDNHPSRETDANFSPAREAYPSRAYERNRSKEKTLKLHTCHAFISAPLPICHPSLNRTARFVCVSTERARLRTSVSFFRFLKELAT